MKKKIKFDTHIRNKHEITTDGRVAYEEFRMYVFIYAHDVFKQLLKITMQLIFR